MVTYLNSEEIEYVIPTTGFFSAAISLLLTNPRKVIPFPGTPDPDIPF